MTYNQVQYFRINHLAGEFWGIDITRTNKYYLKYNSVCRQQIMYTRMADRGN